MTWETGLGICGFAVAIVLAAVRIYDFLRDRPAVKVIVCWGLSDHPPPEGDPFPAIRLRAVNAGRRPVTIADAYLELSSGKRLAQPFHGSPPQTLQETERCQLVLDMDDITAMLEEGQAVVAAVFADTTGREYRCKWDFDPHRSTRKQPARDRPEDVERSNDA